MSLNFAALSPKDAIGFIVETFTNPLTRLHRPLLHGVQGVGKSSILRAVARIMDADLYDLRLVQVESTDIRGLTVVDPVTGTTKHMRPDFRSEEHTSELQSLMRISYAVFCLKKKKKK